LKEDYGRTRPGPSYARRTHAQLTLNVSCYHVVLFHDPAGASIPAHSFPRRAIFTISFYAFLSSNVLHRARQRQRRRRRRYPLFSHSDACNECLVFGLIGERFQFQFLVFNRCILDTPLSISRRLLISSFCLTSDLLLYSYQSAAF
jgi:hypothetical protein